ncbi:MAG: hypothetical protein ABL949_05510 [Fimbriimonadaceae bacterium]
MKTPGIVGGTSYVSSAETYRHINHLYSQQQGGFDFHQIILYSVNLGEGVMFRYAPMTPDFSTLNMQ